MSPPDESHFMASFIQEEITDLLAQTVANILPNLPPITRLRLLAFMHLLEDPALMKADLNVEPSGYLRLTLAAGGPGKGQQH
ncbi:hypothetical protein MAE02_37940 [Microvirga aerophila]|uniref:Uncharacterized protein n=2 Tax=Microvirga aerophila TaxID=670291 RepID=A0A512BVV6_9HYPH|nr:hypothetical protein MAE02_37940 [Microvirga aerophila]